MLHTLFDVESPPSHLYYSPGANQASRRVPHRSTGGCCADNAGYADRTVRLAKGNDRAQSAPVNQPQAKLFGGMDLFEDGSQRLARAVRRKDVDPALTGALPRGVEPRAAESDVFAIG